MPGMPRYVSRIRVLELFQLTDDWGQDRHLKCKLTFNGSLALLGLLLVALSETTQPFYPHTSSIPDVAAAGWHNDRPAFTALTAFDDFHDSGKLCKLTIHRRR
jgi:hypothetical protein